MCLGDDGLDIVHVEGLVQNAIRSAFQCGLDQFRRSECCHEYHGTLWETAPNVFEQAQIVRIWQAQVEQSDINRGVTHGIPGRDCTCGFDHRVPGATQHFGDRPSKEGFIVNHEYRQGSLPPCARPNLPKEAP